MAPAPQLLLTYDFPPIGGGIARWMAELAKRYPPGSLVVSTGQHPDSPDVDSTFPNRVDRLPLAARKLRTLRGLHGLKLDDTRVRQACPERLQRVSRQRRDNHPCPGW